MARKDARRISTQEQLEGFLDEFWIARTPGCNPPPPELGLRNLDIRLLRKAVQGDIDLYRASPSG